MNKLLLASLVTLAACGGAPDAEPPEAEAVSPDVTLALAVARGVEAAPAAVDSVLIANGLTRTGFDSLLYRIAEDGTLSAQYTAGRR